MTGRRVGWRMRAIALAAGAVLAAGSASALGGGARVIGRVTDAAGNPVTQATVVVIPADSAAPRARATTGDTGGFEFASLPAGGYTLRVERAGFRDRSLRLELVEGKLETVIARLPRARVTQVAEQSAPARTP